MRGMVVWSHKCAFCVNVTRVVVDLDVLCAWLD